MTDNSTSSEEDGYKSQEKELKNQLKKDLRDADIKMKKAKAEEAVLKLISAKQKEEQALINTKGKFGTKTEPRKSLSTYFRNQNKFEVSAITILDRKASILIKICPTILSGLIVFHEYIEDNVNNGSIITMILLIGLLSSLIMAIISIKPSSRQFDKIVRDEIKSIYPNHLENAFFTWDFNSFKDYEESMQKVVKSQDLQLGNQVRATYILGKSNSLIAKNIDYAYNAFLLSFILAALVFVFS